MPGRDAQTCGEEAEDAPSTSRTASLVLGGSSPDGDFLGCSAVPGSDTGTGTVAPGTANAPSVKTIATALLTWLSGAQRDLPWRKDRLPYAVWVSEVMLQQTQATTVIPYFQRWMARFPDVRALASAPLDDVLRQWEGLGYYSRGRNLHRTAQIIMAQHGGQVPSERRSLLALPGIGPYTAGAILSLAYGQAEPVLDGNVARVLCRLYDFAEAPSTPQAQTQLWKWADLLVKAAPTGLAGPLNEALMELGALVCTPRNPTCSACPLNGFCKAHAVGTEKARPIRRKSKALPHHHVASAVVFSDQEDRVLLIQRPPQGLLGGLWGFPGGILAEGESADSGVVRTVAAQTGVEVSTKHLFVELEHAYTHFRITLHVYSAELVSGTPVALTCAEVKWVDVPRLGDHPMPVTDRRVARKLMSRHSSSLG